MKTSIRESISTEDMLTKLKAGSLIGRQLWSVEPAFDEVYLQYHMINNKPVIMMYGKVEGIITKADVWQPDHSDIIAADWFEMQ